MFKVLTHQPTDPVLALMGLFERDRRPGAVDLGIGAYRNEQGRIPIFRAVKLAEQMLWREQDTKSYIGPAGDLEFLDALWSLVGGAAGGTRATAGVQTPGGTGALRLAAEVARRAGRQRVLIGSPNWRDHVEIFEAAGLRVERYPFFDVPSQTMLFDRIMEAFAAAGPGDVAVLHAGCHNPSGAVLSLSHWSAIADGLARRGILPVIDIAYQGFGQGLEEDARGLRNLVAQVPEALVAVSLSKTFGLYRERVGAIFATAATDGAAEIARSNLVSVARALYLMPPAHGAAVARMILQDARLKQDWTSELEDMRLRIALIRSMLASRLAVRWPALAAMSDQEGLFSILPLDEAQIMNARSNHGIYMSLCGRINIAGLRMADVDRVATDIVRL